MPDRSRRPTSLVSTSTPKWILIRISSKLNALFVKFRGNRMATPERDSKSNSPEREEKPAAIDERTEPADETTTSPSEVARGTINANIVDLAVSFGKYFLAFLLVYFMGYYGFSTAWIVVGLVMFVLREKLRQEKDFQLGIARAAAVNEKASILARVEDLPSWVYFPDTERAEWINKMLLQLWPYVGHYVKDFLVQNIEPMMQDAIKASTKFGSFKFDRIDLGDISPRVGGIKVYREHVSRHEIIMDIELFYSGDCDIQVLISKLRAGIKDIQLHGTLRCIFKPLINEMPLVGGVQYFFLNTPVIDFNLTNLADVLDIPGVGDLLRKIVTDQIAYMMVLPNKMSYKLSDSVPSKLLRFNEPAGVLRINVVEARDLMKKDMNVLGFGKSDPYGIISVGAQEFKTKVINNTINPVWDFWCEATVDQMRGQYVDMVFYDQDAGFGSFNDDLLGRLSVDVQTIASKGQADMWIPLEDAKTGQVHLKIQWLGLGTDAIDLHVQQREVEMMKELGLSTCLLLVYVDSARGLPNAGKAPVEPSPQVKLVLGTQKFETLYQKNTNDPVWEESFTFCVVNPEMQELLIEVVDQKTSKSLGCLTYHVSRLLHCDKLEQSQQPFHLKNSGPQSKIILSCHLRILKSGVIVPLEVRSDSPGASHSRTASESGQPGSSRSSPAHESSSRGHSPSTDPAKADAAKNAAAQDGLEPETLLRQRSLKEPSPESIHGLGNVQITLRYSPQRNRLIIVIHKVTDLPFYEINDPPDPYVKMYLQPDRNRDSKRKTQIVKNTCNPVFDETFEYLMTQTDLNCCQLLVSVNNRTSSMFGKSTVIGQTTIDLSQLDLSKALTNWYSFEPDRRGSN